MFWTPKKQFLSEPSDTESQLEAAIAEISDILFGPARIYLDVKRLIGAKGKTKNIPDGYLIDLTSKREPSLYVVEVELASHDPLNHVAVQVLEFSLSFETSQVRLKAILRDALKEKPDALQACEVYAAANGFENVDYLLEKMIQKENAFNALVIIDELAAELETLLLKRFKFPVEILTLRRFCTADGMKAYEFEPFLADLSLPDTGVHKTACAIRSPIDPSEVDTIVVPAQEEGFQEVFLGENRWYQIRIHTSMIPAIKYIAAYRTSPVSAITHVARVKNIELWQETGKYVVNFAEPAKEIGPIRLVPKPIGAVIPLRGPRYTSYARLFKATDLDEAF